MKSTCITDGYEILVLYYKAISKFDNNLYFVDDLPSLYYNKKL